MKKIGLYWLVSLLLMQPAIAGDTERAYVTKFMTYIQWRDHLPTTPTPEFLEFIATSSPLTIALREKWLYQLALSHNWELFNQYYQPSTDLSLQCYALMAKNNLGQQENITNEAVKIWLNTDEPPSACNALFASLMKQHAFSNELIEQRIILSLAKNKFNLAHDLLLQLTPSRTDEVDLLKHIQRDPKFITHLSYTPLHSYFYLYGLKLMIPRDMDRAIKIWSLPLSKKFLVKSQQQDFITKIALYKAMRNAKDTDAWFALIQPNDPVIIEWQIRYALVHNHWQQVLDLTQHLEDQNAPIWQYWQARAYQKLNHPIEAELLYKNIATKRNYYGFLASLRLHQPLQFEHTGIFTQQNQELLNDYKPILDQVKNLYLTNQKLAASRLLNAFITELPTKDRIEIAYWVDQELHWYGKSVALSLLDELNNHLELRFPLAEQDTITQQAQKYKIPAALVYAIIRQESAFREDIISPAGAYGLMQLLPLTAKNTARREKIAFNDANQLFIPQKNIELGVAYLHQLAPQLNSHPVLMAAAYNAGPKQAKLWLKNNQTNSLDIWIESLPWIETRNYIKNVIAFYAVYQYRLKQKPDLNFMDI
jgi:soluble lytic murein transglycosylase